MDEDSIKNLKDKPKLETKEDVVKVQKILLQKRKQIIDEGPKLSLCIKDAPFYLMSLFNVDGSPKGNFNVSESQQKKIALALKHPSHKSSTDQTYWGHLSADDEYRIQVMPTFFSDEELYYLQLHERIVKKINDVEIKLVPLYLQKDNFSERVKDYKESIGSVKDKLQKYDDMLILLENLKSILPASPRIVIISDEDPSLPR